MSETTGTEATGSDPGATVTIPEGYVPADTVEKAREEARRGYQSENDKLKAELADLRAAGAAATPAANEDGGFDPVAFRRQLLGDVSTVIGMTSAADKLRAEFPHADPGLLAPDSVASFGSPESLRLAVQDSHRRVAAILDTEREALEKKIRDEIAAGGSGGAAGDPGGKPQAPGSDPSGADIAAMTVPELNAFEAAHPGVVDRVLAKVGG